MNAYDQLLAGSQSKMRHLGRNIIDRGYEARLASDDETKTDAFRLRYASYRHQGHVEARADGMLFDHFDDLPTTKTVVVYAQGRPVGSIRTCLLRRDQMTTSPCRETYPSEIQSILDSLPPHRSETDGVEVNRMVRAPESADDQGLVFILYRLAGYLALCENFQVIVTCVRQHHLPFYRRLSFEQIGGPKVYPGLTCPMLLLKIGRSAYDKMRGGFKLMDPDVGNAGVLCGLESGMTVRPQLAYRV